MHHTRKTHNAHNETQRRMKNLLSKERGRIKPHYNIAHLRDDGTIFRIEPNWDWIGSNMVAVKFHSIDWHFDKSFKSLEHAKKHKFYKRISKSKSKYWKFAKKRLHKIWRRKNPYVLTFTYKDAKGCSMFDLW